MGERVDYLVSRLRDEGRTLAGQLDMLLPEQWSATIYTEPTPWTLKDLLAHLVSAERGLLRLVADVADGGPGAPSDFDYNAFNASEVLALACRTPAELITDFRAARSDTIALVGRLNDADLQRRGRHPALGEIALEDFIKTIYRHAKIHTRDALGALSK